MPLLIDGHPSTFNVLKKEPYRFNIEQKRITGDEKQRPFEATTSPSYHVVEAIYAYGVGDGILGKSIGPLLGSCKHDNLLNAGLAEDRT
jgi:hypothetical protein